MEPKLYKIGSFNVSMTTVVAGDWNISDFQIGIIGGPKIEPGNNMEMKTIATESVFEWNISSYKLTTCTNM